MHKISIIAPVGTSPPVITEFLQYVQEAIFERVTDLTLIATKEPAVLNGIELIKAAVKKRYPQVHVHIVELSFTDITSDKDHLEFMKICAKTLGDQHEVHQADKIYLCVAGGRKDMCITLALLGQYFGVNGVFHIIMPDVKSFNIELERARHEISELAQSETKEEYYEKNREIFENLMFPHPSSYSVIKIPIMPYPLVILNDVLKLLSGSQAVDRGEVKLSLDVLEGMHAAGLVKVASRRIYVTDEGRHFSEVLKTTVGGKSTVK